MENAGKKSKFSKIKSGFTTQNILCLFVILCPIFDIASFLFRNAFETNISISTFLRPIIPICVLLCIFIKSKNKTKLKLFLIGLTYIIYAICHLLIVRPLFTGCSYGSMMTEIQYICNFTFIMVDLIAYYYTFKIQKDDTAQQIEQKRLGIENLKKSIVIMLAVYICSILLAIITHTSSYTYGETSTGYKGWIESGNSLSAILCLSTFVAFGQVKSKNIKWRIFSIITLILTGIYLCFIIGTRVGLFGFFLSLSAFIFYEVIFSKNKKVLIAGGTIFIVGILAVGLLGSKTLQRRKQINEAAENNLDQSTGEVLHISTSMLEIYNSIMDNTIEEGYMSDAQKQATVDLYNYTKEHNIASNDNRMQQLIYNLFLVKYQKNPVTIIFGNGYNTNFREMRMENEIPCFALNFGIIGFVLFIGAFLAIIVYAIVQVIKHIKNLNSELMMYLSGCALSLILATVSGFVFFASSCMVVIVVTNVLMLENIESIKNSKMHEKKNKQT